MRYNCFGKNQAKVGYMTEKEIKIRVIEYLLKHEKHSVVVPEVTLGHLTSPSGSYVRADIFAVNGDISIYEIKTERDNLKRIENQIENYLKYANRVYIVTVKKYIDAVKKLDERVGVYEISGDSLNLVREPKYTPISCERAIEYWTGKELKHLFRGVKGWYKLGKYEAIRKLKSFLSCDHIVNLTIFMLKERYKDEYDYIRMSIMSDSVENPFKKRVEKKTPSITPLKDIRFGVLADIM